MTISKKIIAIIPARMASSRYPGKPIIDICGKSMIEHVWQRTQLNTRIDEVYIATCDEKIKKVAENFGAKVIMTGSNHVRCTERVAEACSYLINNGDDFDIILNIQGDEPLLHPKTLDLLIDPFLKTNHINSVNLIEPLETEDDVQNYNNVKVVFDKNNFVLYFSRLPIPSGVGIKHFKQLGIYSLTKETILKYNKLDETPLELSESIDLLRFLENGIQIKVAISDYKTMGVDIPADRKKVIELLAADKVFQQYRTL
jgi:3-deoxy-manno-octulosonate cytidylyltransferase (CMP-KDO synthetase)